MTRQLAFLGFLLVMAIGLAGLVPPALPRAAWISDEALVLGLVVLWALAHSAWSAWRGGK